MSQYEKHDPTTLYPVPPFPKQEQSLPGAAWKMDGRRGASRHRASLPSSCGSPR